MYKFGRALALCALMIGCALYIAVMMPILLIVDLFKKERRKS